MGVSVHDWPTPSLYPSPHPTQIAPNAPQSSVSGHSLAAGFVSGSQLDVLQVTAPGVPDLPAPTPHFVAHPVGSARIHLPEEWIMSNIQANKLGKKNSRGTSLSALSYLH